jgi:ParB/RepB/Spo0J family partition protein
MATKFAVDATKRDYFLFDADQVDIDESLIGGRTFTPDLSDLRASIRTIGQHTPGTVMKIPGREQPVVVAGRCRLLAIREENANLPKDQKIKFKATLFSGNEEEAEKVAISENFDRHDWSPIDIAHISRRLMDRRGYDEKQVADVFHRSPAWVTQHLGLLTLSGKMQKEIAAKEVPAAAAFMAVQMREAGKSEEEVREVLAAAATLDPKGKVKPINVLQVAREKGALGEGQQPARKMSEVRKFNRATIERELEADPNSVVAEFLKEYEKFLDGKYSEAQMYNRYAKYLIKG